MSTLASACRVPSRMFRPIVQAPPRLIGLLLADQQQFADDREIIMTPRASLVALALSAVVAAAAPALGETTLRIAMTASDIPTTTGMPNNGFEGMRFLGYPVFQGLIGFDLTTTGPVKLLPHLAETWEQAQDDRKTWIFHL